MRDESHRDSRARLDDALDKTDPIGAAGDIVPKDNDELYAAERRFHALIRKLERIAGCMDALQSELERFGGSLGQPAAQVTGAGIINLIVKAEALSSELIRFSTVLRRSEARAASRSAIGRS